MRTADAIVAVVDAEAVISIDSSGSITADRPVPAEAMRALEVAPRVAAEFARGDIFPSPECLTAIAEASGTPLSERWTYARFAPWVVDRALSSGRLRREGGGFVFDSSR